MRVLTYTSPARGHLYPIMSTLLELHERGHEVHVRTLASEVESVRAAGLEAEPMDPRIEAIELDDYRYETPHEALRGTFRSWAARGRHEVPDLHRAIEAVEPDFLLIDVTTAGAAAVAEAGDLPWAQWMPFFQHAQLPGEPPARGLIPYTMTADGMEMLNAMRALAGLAPLAGPDETLRAPLHLYLTAEPFETPDFELPPSFRMVGPGLWEPPAPAPEWVPEFARPLVMVTASSEFQLDHALITTALDALRDEPVGVAASTVAHDAADFDVPANARVERWLPHGPVIRESGCVVCHGGMGITQRALASGVPVCVVPFGRDQMEVAGRVVAAGAGTAVMPWDLGPGTLRSAVREAMTMRAGAERIAEAFRQAGGASAAADSVEALTGARAPA